MRRNRLLWLGIGAVALVLALWLGLALALVASTFEAEQRAHLGELLAPRAPLLGLAWIVIVLLAAAGLHWAVRRYALAPLRLAEQTRALLDAVDAVPLPSSGPAEMSTLAAAINALATQRDALRADLAARVAEASRRVQEERNRLAALVGELAQAVVVCNLDGRIVLYNRRARLQFRALSEQPELAEGAELIGIGRSIYGVFDRELVAHSLEGILMRLERGAAQPSAQFVTTTRAGQLLRVQMAPVRAAGPEGASAESAALQGFVLMLENVTKAFQEDSGREHVLQELSERTAAALARMQDALATLTQPEDEHHSGAADADARSGALGILRQQLGALDEGLRAWNEVRSRSLQQRWPLEDVFAGDFLRAASRRIEAACGRTAVIDPTEAALWMRVDSFSLMQALAYLATRLVGEYEVRFLRLRVAPVNERAQLDLVWSGQAMSTETAMSWEADPMRLGGEHSALSVREVVERHGAQWWFERDRLRNEAFFRFVLPQVHETEQSESARILQGESRPEYYDFDLFAHRESEVALHDCTLSQLAFTVFDTETTGLKPSEGDEIIQIGAVRVVNGRVLRQEAFEQLIDPGRSIPAASIPIHGITPDMVMGKPRIDAVLPAFHRFTRDTVLVAHNAAFDMKFLQLREKSSGLRFDQPVLDTLLLSAVVHPNQDSHRLEAIAERFGVTVLGRHTALGDALVTAEVLLRLIPLLRAMGIHTLGQALDAARTTYYARLKY